MVAEQYSRGRSAVSAWAINRWSIRGSLLRMRSKRCHTATCWSAFEVVKPAGFDGADQVGECCIEGVEGLIHYRALVAFWCCGVPEFHAPIVFEDVFDAKCVSQQYKES
jgi:hypothetical protein